jgi:lipase
VLLHLHEWGDRDAPPLLCVHGVQAHGARFRKLAEERLASRFRVLAPDLRGHGRSQWEPPWSIEQHIEDLLETLSAAGVEQTAMVGHSFGGRLALELTARGVIERSVLLDPAVWVPPTIALERAQALVRDRSFADVEEALAERRPLSPLAPRELLEEEFREHLVLDDDGRLRFRYSTAAVIAAYGELSKPPPDWARVQVPTLLVAGQDTDVTVPAVVEAVTFELGDNLTVVTVPGRHVVLWDAFDETADAIDTFLR